MKRDGSPLYLKRIECPICATINEFETIRMGAYTEDGRDTDFRPTGRQWRNEKYADVNPLLYFMGTCESCFYTREFNRQFQEWKEDTTFRTYRQKTLRRRHLSALADSDSPLRRLGGGLWPSLYPIETAINKMLLGIMDEGLLEHPSDFDLGRWYLRVGWMFRERGEGRCPPPSPRSVHRRRLFGALEHLQADSVRLVERLAGVRELVENHSESMAAAPEDAERPARCRREMAGLAENLDGFNESLDALVDGMNESTSPLVGEEGLPGTESYGDYPSYEAFLAAIKVDWPVAATNEHEALRFSLKHYRIAYEAGRNIEPGNAHIQIVYMIGELARRVDEVDEARQYFDVAIRLGREWIHQHSADRSRTALARHIVDLAIEQTHLINDQSKVHAQSARTEP